MKYNTSSLLLLMGLTFSAIQDIGAQSGTLSDTTKLEKHLSILNNKFYFDFPVNAVVSPRVADIMAADPNVNKETRIIADRGPMRLVFLAQELYALGGSSLVNDIMQEKEPDYDFRRKVLTDTDSVLTILSTPTRFDSTASAILVNSLLIRSPDNTVSRVDVFINPDAYSLKEEYMKLTEKVFATLVKGNRRIDLSAKEETHKIFGTSSRFLFKLPKNYFVTVDEKYDFAVYKLNKFKNSLTDTTYTSITIYTGHYPSYFYKEYGYTADKTVSSKGSFGQNSIDWLFINDEAQHFFLKEQFIPSDTIEKGLVLHVAMLSNKKEVLRELEKIVESIKIMY